MLGLAFLALGPYMLQLMTVNVRHADRKALEL